MTVVMAGCGDLGTEAGLRFAAAGRRVVGLRRHPDVLPAVIEGRGVDLAREVPDVPADTDTVVVALTPSSRDASGYRDAYVTAPAHLLDGVERAGAHPKRVLMVSSTAMYGAIDDGRWLDESSPLAPRPVTGEIVREAEETLHERVPDAIVLRLSGLYGPGRDRMQRQVREGAANEGPERWTNRIHRDDAAAAIVHLTTEVDAPQRAYLGTDSTPALRSEVAAFLADEMGEVSLVSPVSPVSPQSNAPVAGKRIDNARLLSTGFGFAYPGFREGYRALLAEPGRRHP